MYVTSGRSRLAFWPIRRLPLRLPQAARVTLAGRRKRLTSSPKTWPEPVTRAQLGARVAASLEARGEPQKLARQPARSLPFHLLRLQRLDQQRARLALLPSRVSLLPSKLDRPLQVSEGRANHCFNRGRPTAKGFLGADNEDSNTEESGSDEPPSSKKQKGRAG